MPDLSRTELSPVKRALNEIRTLQARVRELESAVARDSSREPIAVVGAGLRFPGGVVDMTSFWVLLSQGADAVAEIPRDRWDWRNYFDADADAPGMMVTRHGGFLDGVDLFDASFFGISPREAAMMDPQHRLILEVAWEALENSGHVPADLQESLTGVFLGISNHDYNRMALRDPEGIDAYSGSGTSPSMVAGRLSYVLGVHGPSLAVDTSCSSSLVAVHLACQSLRQRECDTAFAGGVNLILSPEPNITLSKAHMMALDGRCKTFDEAADGYVRGEGCGVVVLKRLSEARADGDRILATIRGSAVNHDGRSGGLTAPNGPAQAVVIRKALAQAGVEAGEVGYVEAHGTGTALGDPIEVETLAHVMGEGRVAGNALAVGSVKTNIGHLEAASGIAGLLKTVLMLQHRSLLPSLHLNRKSSHIDWEHLSVTVPTACSPWEPRSGKFYAGVSSFGFSGTNAHVVLEAAQPTERLTGTNKPRAGGQVYILTLSARTETALVALRARYADALRACAPEGLEDFCFTANAGRAPFSHRMAVLGETAEELAEGLEASDGSTSQKNLFRGTVEDGEAGRLGFLFTGQGSQYAGMGRVLYESAPVFRKTIERLAAVWKDETGEDLVSVLYGTEPEERTESEERTGSGELKEARKAQPALYAVESALAELWRSWGIEPSVVLGHSLGEYVAAAVAGIFSPEDGLRLVCARARLMDTLTRPGAMRSIAASAERVGKEIQGLEQEVSVAVINGPENVVLSGRKETVERVAAKFEAEGVRTRALDVTHAFHSPELDPILDEFERCAEKVKYQEPKIRVISNRTGRAAQSGEMSRARYWREQMRSTVRFAEGLEAALQTGVKTFVEIGPQPHLKSLAVRIDGDLENRIGTSLRKQHGDWSTMLSTLSSLYVQGYRIGWRGFYQGQKRIRVPLPTYPFERQRYWLASDGLESSQRIWQHATSAALSQSTLVPLGMQIEEFPGRWNALERLTLAEMLQTLRGIGAFAGAGESHDAASLVRRYGISPTQEKLMGRWMDSLAASGYLDRDGSRYVSAAPLPVPRTEEAWSEVEALLSNDPSMLAYLHNCTTHLKDVLLGQTSPLDTLFPGGSSELAQNLYEKSVGSHYANGIVAEAVEDGCAGASTHRRLRILELGGGTGATTTAILPRLPEGRVSYFFTDVSELFLDRASTRFKQYPFVRYGLLDIENREHLARHAGSFDLVIAANVLHATRDLEATLAGIRGLLTPGGSLILLEATKKLAWHNITIGLIEGWQKADDQIRRTRTLLDVEEWREALHGAGFDEFVSAPEAGSPMGEIGSHVMLARRNVQGNRQTEPADTEPSSSGMEWSFTSASDRSGAEEAAPTITTLLQNSPVAEHHEIVRDAIRAEIGRVLRLSHNQWPGSHDRLMDIGMDSLMAVELRNRLEKVFDLEGIPATLMFDYPTSEAIATYLLGRLEPETSSDGSLSNTPVTELQGPIDEPDFSEIDDLSDEEIAVMLQRRLSEK